MKVVIVGGVAGGASAAARIRRLDETAEIVVFERSGYVSYANCGLPYYIGGVIEDPGRLTLQTPESFKSRFGIDVRVRHEVTAIDRERKTVSVTDLETGRTFEERYDKLLLSPGARPIRPPMPGLDASRLFTLRTVEDTLTIRAFVEREKPRRAVLAGGGFIGLEVAENLRELGMEVTVVQLLDQLLTPLDKDMASFVHARFRSHGVRLMLNTAVRGFEDYRCALEAAFAAAGVPLFTARRADVLSKPLPALIAGAYEIILGGWEQAEVFSYLRTGLAGLTDAETDKLENYCCIWSIRARH